MMKVGFTGTRHGMTYAQENELCALLREHAIAEFHHGDCIGADERAVAYVRVIWPTAEVHGHPMDSDKARAYTRSDIWYKPQPPLERNRHIVDATELLIACPHTAREVLRSGTWATVRYARKRGAKIIIVQPNGERV